ncbi:MAG: hypothetical protein ACK4IY_10340, partial [Chitinophagales bacterium]
SGGTPGYNYYWSDGVTEADRFDLPVGTYFLTVTDANGCSADWSTILNADSTLACLISGDTLICEGGSTELSAPAGYTYLWNTGDTTQNIYVSSAGVYSVTIWADSACYTSCSIEVELLPALVNNMYVSLCSGDTYTLPDGIIITDAGIYTSTISGSSGCDSVIQTHVTVFPAYVISQFAEICDGDSYTLPDGTVVNTAGVYNSVFTTSNGCDSIIITEVAVDFSLTDTVMANICDGDSYLLPDGVIVSAPGIYISIPDIITGCDTLIVTNLTVNPAFTSIVNASICDGENYTLPDGTSVTTSGTYITNLTTINGCDSTITTNLTVHPVYTAAVDASICEGET